MDIECRWPESVHDAKVFSNSKIMKNLLAKKTSSTELTILSGYHAIRNYIIGDPAYPLTSYCIKEFTSCSNNREVIFNNMLRSAREFVKLRSLRAFAPSCLTCIRRLRGLIFTRLNYASCAPYLRFLVTRF